jgi:integrase
VERTKTHSRRELIPIVDDFRAQLVDLRKREPEREYLVEYKGRRVNGLKTAWPNALKKAGITRRLRLYDLRHLFASTLLQNGADLKAVSQLLGHSSPTMTLSVYYHLIDDQKRQAVESLNVGKHIDTHTGSK